MVWLMILLTVHEYIMPVELSTPMWKRDVITGLYWRVPTDLCNPCSPHSHCRAVSGLSSHFWVLWKDIVSPATVLSTSESSVIIITSRVSVLAPAFLVSIFFSTICIALPN